MTVDRRTEGSREVGSGLRPAASHGRAARRRRSPVRRGRGDPHQQGGLIIDPIVLSDRFDRALIYATQVHAGQVRKGTHTPYVAHPLAVAALVLEHGGGEDEAIAALLHDAAEDQGGELRLADIRGRFGERVEAITRACSDDLPAAGEQKRDWRERKEAYLAHLMVVDRGVLLVSAADKLHNARAILIDYGTVGEALWARFKASRDDTLWYYGRASQILGERLGVPLTRELAETVARLAELVGEYAPEPPSEPDDDELAPQAQPNA